MLRGMRVVLLSAGFAACVPPDGAAPATTDRGSLADQLRSVSRLRVFFGHQSVGNDVIQGLRELASEAGVPLRIVEDGPPGAPPEPAFLHAMVGENTRPDTKIAAFAEAVSRGRPGPNGIALYKFCYVDFDANTDVVALFERYAASHRELVARHPGVTFVHVTVPLTVTQGGLKGYLKNLTGRGAAGELENVKRHEFNELLRSRFAGKEPLFDLALAESTDEAGRSSFFERDGKRVPRLVAAFTDDGGHLNDRGRRRVARTLVEFLAELEAR